jgi:hypothetical protein
MDFNDKWLRVIVYAGAAALVTIFGAVAKEFIFEK